MDRARAQRDRVRGDSTFRAYSADARGYVYFYLDRPDGDEPTLVRTDQVALEVYWKAPDSTKQRIVGMRDEERLPTNISYHLDHLTVVQDEFADVIRLGDGDEVAAVVHPAAPGSRAVYDFRVADSLTIRFGGAGADVRVYEVEVRPRDFSAPGFIGSVFLDRENAAIVRMNFTFTPSSYVDDYLDYIRISLDNSLWDGRYWLPYEQRVELRRELPWLDFPAGTVIRGRYRIRGYAFNPELPPGLFRSQTVSALPRQQLRAFPFERGLHAELDEEGLAPLPALDEIRDEARRIVGRQLLSGLAGQRLWVPGASQALRYTRAEGVTLGLGGSFAAADRVRVRVHGGWSFGRQKPHAQLRVTPTGEDGAQGARWEVGFYENQPRELGAVPAVSGAFNTLSGALADLDYTAPWFASGARVEWRAIRSRGVTLALSATVEAQRSGSNEVTDGAAGFGAALDRPVPQIERGTGATVSAAVQMTPSLAWTAETVASATRLNGRTHTSLRAGVTYARAWLERGLDLQAALRSGWASTDAPAQAGVLLGGRGTLPGHGFHGYTADRWTLLTGELSRDLRLPWLRASLQGSLGRGWLRASARPLPAGWSATDTERWRASLGIGARLLWDTVRISAVRGLGPGGDWEWILAVSPRFRPWL